MSDDHQTEHEPQPGESADQAGQQPAAATPSIEQ